MTTLNFVLLMASKGEENPMQFYIMMGLILVVFYFFMIRPQVKRQKETKKFREGLQKGDQVITIGGIHGKIAEVSAENSVVMLDIGNNTKIKVEKVGLVKDVAELAQKK